MKTITELAHIARKAKGENVHDSMIPYWKDALSGVSADDILAIESEVTALRGRLAAAEADADVTDEMYLAAKALRLVGQLYPGMTADQSEIHNWDALRRERYTQIYKAMKYAASNPTKEG